MSSFSFRSISQAREEQKRSKSAMQSKVSWGSQVLAYHRIQRGCPQWAPRSSKASQRRGCKCWPVSAFAKPMVTSDFGVWSALALAGASGLWSVPLVVAPSPCVRCSHLCKLFARALVVCKAVGELYPARSE